MFRPSMESVQVFFGLTVIFVADKVAPKKFKMSRVLFVNRSYRKGSKMIFLFNTYFNSVFPTALLLQYDWPSQECEGSYKPARI